VRDRKEIAKFFKISKSSPLYQAGRKVTDEEIRDFILGTPGKTPQGIIAPAATQQVGNLGLIQYNSGKDFFGNNVSDTPSIGAHEGE
jgi:hypothetical protein